MTILLALFFWVGADEWFQRGLAALKAGDTTQARVALEEAVRLAPTEPMMWLGVAEARLRSGEPKLAVQAVGTAGRLAPGDVRVQQGRAMFARRMGQTAQALLDARQEKPAEAILLEAVKAYPKEAELWRLLGLAHYAQGKNAAALAAFGNAIDLAPDEASLYAGLETLLPGGKPVELRLAKFAAAHPDSPLGWYLLGLERGDPALWQKSLNLDPMFWPAAFALHKHVPSDQALQLLEQVVALNPDYAPAHYALSQLYGKRGDRDKALAARKRHHELTNQAR